MANTGGEPAHELTAVELMTSRTNQVGAPAKASERSPRANQDC